MSICRLSLVYLLFHPRTIVKIRHTKLPSICVVCGSRININKLANISVRWPNFVVALPSARSWSPDHMSKCCVCIYRYVFRVVCSCGWNDVYFHCPILQCHPVWVLLAFAHFHFHWHTHNNFTQSTARFSSRVPRCVSSVCVLAVSSTSRVHFVHRLYAQPNPSCNASIVSHSVFRVVRWWRCVYILTIFSA